MRVVVIAERAERVALLSALATSAGHEVVAATPPGLLSAVAAARPEILLVDAAEEPERARRDLARARAALEASVPVVLVLARGSAWLHGALPIDMQPAVALGNAELADALDAALRRAAGAPTTLATAGEAVRRLGQLTWMPASREVVGPTGSVVLTASETSIMDVLIGRPGVVVPAAAVSRALWGDVILDKHGRAAIRSHVHTLRRKLRAAGLDGALVSLPGWGYRIDVGGGPGPGAAPRPVGSR